MNDDVLNTADLYLMDFVYIYEMMKTLKETHGLTQARARTQACTRWRARAHKERFIM